MINFDVTLEDAYLAYRQAKNTLYFEKSQRSLYGIAEFENDLWRNIRLVRDRLRRSKALFDSVETPSAHLAPKKLRSPLPNDGVTRIGTKTIRQPMLEVQARVLLSVPTAIAEMIYLWRFGPIVESMLSRDSVGYRLNVVDGAIDRNRRSLFQYWPERYQEFRTVPVSTARRVLKADVDAVTVVSADMRSYYDSIDPSFLLSDSFLADLSRTALSHSMAFDRADFVTHTSSLLSMYRAVREQYSRLTGFEWSVGIPIGSLVSRLIANAALATLDEYVRQQPQVVAYRRYVDDMVIVVKGSSTSNNRSSEEVLSTLFPVESGSTKDMLCLDSRRLLRAGSTFCIQKDKLRVHHLSGPPGLQFLETVGSNLLGPSSELRTFIDAGALRGEAANHLFRAKGADGSQLTVLREADRAHLERFALANALRSLERIGNLLAVSDARSSAKQTFAKVLSAIEHRSEWLDQAALKLRLLRLAITINDSHFATAILEAVHNVWGTTKGLKDSLAGLTYQGKPVVRERAWISLRDFLNNEAFETVAATVDVNSQMLQLATRYLQHRRKSVTQVGLRRAAHLLANADLRDKDREDDSIRSEFGLFEDPPLPGTSTLVQRFETLNRFATICQSIGDRCWDLPAERMFLLTRPPTYFDIARRWLYDQTLEGLQPDVFKELMDVVNAVRGTKYFEAAATLVDERTVRVAGDSWSFSPVALRPEPRIILGNLWSPHENWVGSATLEKGHTNGKAIKSLSRLIALSSVLDEASQLANEKGRRSSALLILPELAVPRAWFRALANHVIQHTKITLLAGLEYLHRPKALNVINQVVGVFPGPFGQAITLYWNKDMPAREEARLLAARRPSVSFPSTPSQRRRPIAQTVYGDLSVLICSELIEVQAVADLLAEVELIAIPSWNTDTSSYDHLIQSVGLQLNAFLAVANNSEYSDCRVWAPLQKRWERDMCRLISRRSNNVVHVDIPLNELRKFRRAGGVGSKFKPLPPFWPKLGTED